MKDSEIYNTLTWKIGSLFTTPLAKLFPRGSKHREFFGKVFHFFHQSMIRLFIRPGFITMSQLNLNLSCNEWKHLIIDRYLSDNLRIVFFGYSVDHKCWKIRMRLIDMAVNNQHSRLNHFSTQLRMSSEYQHINTKITKENSLVMMETLRLNQSDVALFWSTMAATFSFTLQRALVAGCIILVNFIGGNDYLFRILERELILVDEGS